MKIELLDAHFPSGKSLILNTMRIALLLFFTTSFGFTSYSGLSQEKKVTLNTDELLTVEEVFDLIEEQTPYRFVYPSEVIKDLPEVEVKKGAIKVKDLLADSFLGTTVDYEFKDKKNIVLFKKSIDDKSGKKQQMEISGTVTNEEGVPLPGVNIEVIDTNRGTQTDFDGHYKLTVSKGERLRFSFVGFKDKIVEVEGDEEVNVSLAKGGQLDEVVLIGYEKMDRSRVSSAVSSFNTEDVEQKAVGLTSFDRALGGLVKGVQVTQNTGVPGTAARINIRGITSPLSGGLNEPLYVIDGVPINVDAPFSTSAQIGNPLLTLDPNAIKSIDVLKDAAATSIYGSRGANGVILIETKGGRRDEKPKLEVSYNVTFANPIRELKSLNATDFKKYQGMVAKNTVESINAGGAPESFISQLGFLADVSQDPNSGKYVYNGLLQDAFGDANTNWNDEIYRNLAATHKLRIGFRGGSKNTDYSLFGSATDQKGLRVDSKMQTYSLHSKLNSDLTHGLKAGGTVNLDYSRVNSGSEMFADGNPSTSTVRPDFPVRDEDGNLVPLPNYDLGIEAFAPNPLAKLKKKVDTKSYNFVGNAYLQIEPLKDLSIKGQLSGALHHTDGYNFTPIITQIDQGYTRVSNLTDSDYINSNVTFDLTANYKFIVNEDHFFQALAGFSWDRTRTKSKVYHIYGFPDDDILNDIGSGEDVLRWDSNDIETGMNSFFSRVTYSYKDFLNATFNFRSDASSKFGPGNKRGYFPSGSIGWNLANMEFLKYSDQVNNLNLRVSYGKTGSSNISDFAYLQFFQGSSFYQYGGHQAIVPDDELPNPNIGWETTLGTNIGVDFAFFDSRLSGSVDLYSRKTTGALALTPIPLELGPTSFTSNLMDLTNKGVEVEIDGDIIRSKDFNWSFGVNWAFNRNKLKNLHGANIQSFDLDNYVQGKPIGTIKGYRVEKILEDQDEIDQLNNNSPTGIYSNSSLSIGDYKFKDLNGDGRITTDDREVIGNPEPKFFGGFHTNLNYRHFNLSAFFEYSVGGEAVWSTLSGQIRNTLFQNKLTHYANNVWTPDRPDARYAKPVFNDPSQNARISDRYIFSRSYLRLGSLQLSYNIGRKLLDKLSITDAKIFVSGSNLFTLTHWPGTDPGASSVNTNITYQTENVDPYPLARTFSLGLNVKL